MYLAFGGNWLPEEGEPPYQSGPLYLALLTGASRVLYVQALVSLLLSPYLDTGGAS